jgi:hypothetical protein
MFIDLLEFNRITTGKLSLMDATPFVPVNPRPANVKYLANQQYQSFIKANNARLIFKVESVITRGRVQINVEQWVDFPDAVAANEHKGRWE